MKIQLDNPITHEVVKKMIHEILAISCPDLLLLDFGNHDFESLAVLKFCKEELKNIEPTLRQFNKIAMLSVPPYQGERLATDKLKYFHSEIEANHWLSTVAGRGKS